MRQKHQTGILFSLKKRHPSTEHLEESFTYPIRLEEGLRFSSSDHICALLRLEAQERGLRIDPRTYFNWKESHSSSPTRPLKVSCKICDNSICFRRQGKMWIAKQVENFHNHSASMTREQWKRKLRVQCPTEPYDNGGGDFSIQDLIDDMGPLDDDSKPIDFELSETPNFGNSSNLLFHQDYTKLPQTPIRVPLRPRIIERQSHQHLLIQSIWQYAKQQNFDIHFDKDLIADASGSGALLLVTNDMRQSYRKFGDVLSFDVFQDFVKKKDGENCYLSYVFSVNDTNNRPLVVAYGVINKLTPEVLYKLLFTFLKMHRSDSPKTLMYNYSPQVMGKALDELKRQHRIRINATIHPVYLFRKMKKLMVNLSNEKTEELSNLIHRAMYTRDPDDYQRAISDLVAANIFNEKLMTEFCSAFYHGSRCFVGLYPDNNSFFNQQLSKWFVERRPYLIVYLQRMAALTQELQENSVDEWQECTEEVERGIGDSRFAIMRNNYEDVVFRRLISNFIDGVLNYVQVEQQGDTKVVRQMSSGRLYTVEEWTCSCDELKRTGVGCPHVLMLAAMDETKDYNDLINWRWRRPRLC